mmetsp:Transcript_31993/g.57856  ORF Transcript_31993/g.57856 Transcript_31993/m.57856 type:complete len:248 (+) Transcript_31993:1953-2696(+)
MVIDPYHHPCRDLPLAGDRLDVIPVGLVVGLVDDEDGLEDGGLAVDLPVVHNTEDIARDDTVVDKDRDTHWHSFGDTRDTPKMAVMVASRACTSPNSQGDESLLEVLEERYVRCRCCATRTNAESTMVDLHVDLDRLPFCHSNPSPDTNSAEEEDAYRTTHEDTHHSDHWARSPLSMPSPACPEEAPCPSYSAAEVPNTPHHPCSRHFLRDFAGQCGSPYFDSCSPNYARAGAVTAVAGYCCPFLHF